MKHILILIVAIVTAFSTATASAMGSNGAKETKGLATVVFSANLHCESCKKKIESNIAFEKGVKDIKVDVEAKTVTVTYRPDKTNSENLQKAIAKLGYTVLIKQESAAPKACR